MKILVLTLVIVFITGCSAIREYSNHKYEEEHSVIINQVITHPSGLYSVKVIENGFYYAFDKVGDNSLQISPKDMLGYLVGSYYVIPVTFDNEFDFNNRSVNENFKTFIESSFNNRLNTETEILALRDTTLYDRKGVYFEIFVPGDIKITTMANGGKNYEVYRNHFCYSGVFIKGNKSFLWVTKADPIFINKYEKDKTMFEPETRINALLFIQSLQIQNGF